MVRKICNILFICLFLAVLAIPLLLTKWEDGGVSAAENRTLAASPRLTVDGKWNPQVTGEVETWFMDHLGLRDPLITANTALQYHVFNRMLPSSNYLLGENGDLNYATEAMLLDYAHMNLRSEEELTRIGDAYRKLYDWLRSQDKVFYYIQCYDKHSVYPEQFPDTVKPMGTQSKTEQLMAYLKQNTPVPVIDLKAPLVAAKDSYEVYSNWGDPTHWTHRGAYIGYRYVMDTLNQDLGLTLPVLDEADYDISRYDGSVTINQVLKQYDELEYFTIRSPKAQKQDSALMGTFGKDYRHSLWKNPDAATDKKLLLVCDSYTNDFITEDYAESFAEVWLVWTEYIGQLPEILASYDADIVLMEAAERVDISYRICDLADKLP